MAPSQDKSAAKESKGDKIKQVEKVAQHGIQKIEAPINQDDDNSQSILATSTIVNKKQRAYLKEAARNPKLLTAPLILRGSRDGFTKDAFDTLCANRGPLLIIIRSDNGSIFGACTSVAWPENEFKEVTVADPESFLFSLMRKKEQTHNRLKAGRWFENCLRSHYQNMLSMGTRNELRLYDNCNLTNDNCSNIGGTYRGPSGISTNSYESRTYFTGEESFTVTEIEIYLIENEKV